MASILHLVGSPVDDFHAELSRLYAGACIEALSARTSHTMHVAYVSPDGTWRLPADLRTESLSAAVRMTASEAINHLGVLGIDAVVPQMFRLPGMTTYRALFDFLGIRYLGNPPDVMAIAADKAKTRAVVAAAGVGLLHGALQLVGADRAVAIAVELVEQRIDAGLVAAVPEGRGARPFRQRQAQAGQDDGQGGGSDR